MQRQLGFGFLRVLGASLLACLWCAAAAQAEVEKVRLVWTHDPATTMTIGWCQKSGESDGVEYGLVGQNHSPWPNEPEPRTYNYRPETHGGEKIVSFFVTLTGLQPDRAYSFVIKDSEGGSERMWFKTAPAEPAPFTFVAGGDSRSEEKPRQLGNRLISKIRPLFIAHGGDYENTCSNREMRNWLDEWQLTKSSDGRMYPLIPAHGNHENGVRNFCQLLFNVEKYDAYYALNIGGKLMRLYTLNTELEPGIGYGLFPAGHDAAAWNAQKDWLAADLPQYRDSVKWLVANYHRPLRPHTAHKEEGLGRIAAWAETFHDNGVDLAVECDSHMVKLTYPIRPSDGPGSFESFIRDDDTGTVFIGEGSWAAPYRGNNDDKPWTLASDSFWQYNLIHVASEAMAIRKVVIGWKDNLVDPAAVTELTQAAQEAEPLAMPAGLPIWNSAAGKVLKLPFQSATVNFIGPGSVWKYLDDGSDPGTTWTTAVFDDSGWDDGPAQLGYGDDDEATTIGFGDDPDNKHRAAYFRRSFEVDDPNTVVKLRARLLRDDGAVVHVNGREVVRDNMPDGVITSASFAKRKTWGSDERKFFDYNIDPAILRAGRNTVAVEVHQDSKSSSDLSFDLALVGTVSH